MSGPHCGPIVASSLVTKSLQRYRNVAGKSRENVARDLDWSLVKYARVEDGAVNIATSDLETLLAYYHIGPEEADQLRYLGKVARAPAWWDEHGGVIADKAFLAYIGYESDAATIKMSQGLLVPGLLQTEDYAKVVTALYRPDHAADVVRFRMERQKHVLTRRPRQFYILDEAVIRRRISDIMPRQLEHLIQMSRRAEVTIRVIPFHRGPHVGMRGPFALLEFDLDLEPVLFLESARLGDIVKPARTQNRHADDERASETDGLVRAISDYEEAFRSLERVALNPSESRNLIAQAARDLSGSALE